MFEALKRALTPTSEDATDPATAAAPAAQGECAKCGATRHLHRYVVPRAGGRTYFDKVLCRGCWLDYYANRL